MKKTIGIYYEASFEESSFETGCGGSETWCIQIAKEFLNRGYHVVIFRNGDWIFSPAGVEYVPIELFPSRIEYQSFDAMIFVRMLGAAYELVVNTGCASTIFVQSHDMFIWKDGLYNERLNWLEDADRFQNVDKFIALTNFHKKELMDYNNIPEDMIVVIGNGIDNDVFNKVDSLYTEINTLDRSILWTTAFGRGGDILIDDVLPLVKYEIPEFKVHICGYADVVPEKYKNHPDVVFLGTLSKEEYYMEFRQHACWFLPCVTVEDFGICALEAIMSNCHIVSPWLHGMDDTLKPFRNLRMIYQFGDGDTNGGYHYGGYTTDKESDEYKNACQEAATMIITAYREYHNKTNVAFRKSMKNYVLQTHTWSNVVDKWENAIKSVLSVPFG